MRDAAIQTKHPVIYIMASKRNGTLYTGVSSNLTQRVFQHKEKIMNGFTAKHDCHLLVYYEIHETMGNAILREKQIKSGSRKKKLALIEKDNPEWKDLYQTIL